MRTRAAVVLALSVVIDVISGIAFGLVNGIGIWNGLYFATTTGTTVGYGDITPRGWAAHLLAVVIMITVIPLFTAFFALLATYLTTKHTDEKHNLVLRHIDCRHNELKAHVSEVHSGRPGSDQGVDSGSGVSEHTAGPVNVGGVPGYDQPANAAGDPEGPGSQGGSVPG
jgi:hypothetical protein